MNESYTSVFSVSLLNIMKYQNFYFNNYITNKASTFSSIQHTTGILRISDKCQKTGYFEDTKSNVLYYTQVFSD